MERHIEEPPLINVQLCMCIMQNINVDQFEARFDELCWYFGNLTADFIMKHWLYTLWWCGRSCYMWRDNHRFDISQFTTESRHKLNDLKSCKVIHCANTKLECRTAFNCQERAQKQYYITRTAPDSTVILHFIVTWFNLYCILLSLFTVLK